MNPANKTKDIESIIAIVLGILVFALLLAALLTGCGSFSLKPLQPNHAVRVAEVKERLATDDAHLNGMLASTQQECDKIDARATGWTATSIVVGVLGGGSGVASVFTENTPRYVVGGVGAVLSATAALSAYMSVHYAQQFSRKCTVNVGGM